MKEPVAHHRPVLVTRSSLRPVPKPKQVPKPPRKYVPKQNAKRVAIRRARDFGDIAEWLKTLPCCVCGKKTGQWTPHVFGSGVWGEEVTVIPSHVKSRGSGGRKHANQIPLAVHLEQRQTAMGWESIGLTKEKARDLAKEYQRQFSEKFEVAG